MHNLVKESTGIDFTAFRNDVRAAKEAAMRALGIPPENENKDDGFLKTCPSVGHVLNEVNIDLVHVTSVYLLHPFNSRLDDFLFVLIARVSSVSCLKC